MEGHIEAEHQFGLALLCNLAIICVSPLDFIRPELKMACGRIQIASNKKSALLKQSMREVATMLMEDPPKEEKARIRAEALIRDDNLIEAYEILQLECELLHERIKLIEYSKTCPQDLVGVISTLIWASHRVDITELVLIRKQFTAKYGKSFEENAMRNVDGVLNERVVSKLSVEPPAAYLVQTYLERICEIHKVDWTPSTKLTAGDAIQPMVCSHDAIERICFSSPTIVTTISGSTDWLLDSCRPRHWTRTKRIIFCQYWHDHRCSPASAPDRSVVFDNDK